MARYIAKYSMLALLTMAAFAVMSSSASAVTAKANHDDIKIGLTYNGSTVSVSGVTDPELDLIIKITGEDATEQLMRKDKAAGMWMNVEEITIENIPKIYFLRSTKDPETILSAEQRSQYVVGYPALKEKIDLEPARSPEQKAKLLDDFIMYKEEGRFYSESLGGIEIRPEAGSGSYYTVFDWPYQVPPGQYQVDVYAVKNGEVVDTANSQVIVEQDGAIKALSNLAQNNGAIYGLAAIGVSVTAGFGVGVVFKGGGGSH